MIYSFDDFEINKVYIVSFLKGLWHHPEVMHKIINNSNNKVVKTNLAPFIVNNFYCNYLSGNYMENNLLYLITMMLKDEIDKLENINQIDSFLENTKCGYLLEELRKMADIQSYFKKVIFKTVEEMERRCSFRVINFKVYEILNELKKIKEKEKNKIKSEDDLDKIYEKFINSKILDPSINYSKDDNFENDNNDIFMSKYVAEITINEFEKLAENAKKENKNDLYEYFNQFINNIKLKNKNELYSNTNLMNNMLYKNLGPYLLSFYKNNFLEIISYVNQLIENIMENILLIPSSIKYICKIISILIRQKFKNITKTEENAFISKFLIEKLLIPMIDKPGPYALINEFVVSGNTQNNLKELNYILKKLFSGKLFKNDRNESNYAPFNWFFIEKMEIILNFFEKVTKINLPNYIEKYINNDLEKDDCYDFFNENKDIICSNLSVCLTIDNLICLLAGLEINDKVLENKKIKKLKLSLTKLKSKTTLDEIKNLDEKIRITNKEPKKENTENNDSINYYVYNELIIEDKYKIFFSLNNQISNFYINIRKIEKNKKIDEKEKILIKVKNYLCSSLGNFRTLNQSDFNIDSTSNTIKMLKEIKSYMTLPYFILNNNTVPSIWYMNSIIKYINKIPEDYKNNDYKKLFIELTQNINDSINELDFAKLILFRNKLKFLDKMINYYNNIKQLKNNIIINENIKMVAEQAFIPVDITFNYNEKYIKFDLKKSDIKEKVFEDKIIYEDSKKKFTSLKTIEAFTIYFPNLNKYQKNKDINSLDIIEQLNIHNYINNYFEILKEKILKKKLIDLKKYDSLYNEKIKDYIMSKLYPKIYPIIPNNLDEKIYYNSMKLSWIDPHRLINKDYIFDNILPEILNEFNQINILKTPYQKLKSIKKIMEYIDNIIKFNEGIDKEIGAEDVTPVLNYLFIKAQPKRIYTDIKFTALFTENCGKYENSLANFESMCIVMNNCSAETFGFTKEEFDKRCNEEVNEIKII